MQNYAQIENGTVIRVISIPTDQTHRALEFITNDLALDGAWVAARNAAVGDIYENGEFTPPVEPAPEPVIPQSVTRRQGRLALLEAGKLDAVEAAIAAITDPVERRATEIEYEADTWERSNAFLQAMWAQLGGTESELDDLFVLAASK